MTCRSDHKAFALAVALLAALTGCVGEDKAPQAELAPQSNPKAAALIADAGAAMADGALADAGRKLDEARALDPDNPDLWVAIARLRFRGGEHLTALEAADRALSLGPDHAPALLMRAFMVRDAHGPANALPWFEAALAADPENPDVWAEYAATLGDSGRGRAMLRAVRKLATIAPADPRVLYLQAVLAARGGDPALARSLLVRSGMAELGVPAALQLDATLGLAEGNYDSAATTLSSLIERQPGNTRLRELLARALLLGGHEAELIARFGDEASRSETSPYLVMLVARAHERLGQRDRAAPLLARAYAGAGRGPTVLADRRGLPAPTAAVRQAASVANWTGARSRSQELRRQFPASADVASLAGDALLGAGNVPDALESYALAAQVRRPWPLTRKILFASRRAGDGAAADTLLARHVMGDPNGITGVIELAEARAAHGEWQRVAALIDHVIAIGGGHDPAVLRLRAKAAHALNREAEAQHYAALLAQIRPRQLAPS
ncbi:MAG TPA: tetratricopeptide repeat protein [Erythrobacter sp.]|nr:tetratricopeptide repeat protein [Erythrobacter sp.]